MVLLCHGLHPMPHGAPLAAQAVATDSTSRCRALSAAQVVAMGTSHDGALQGGLDVCVIPPLSHTSGGYELHHSGSPPGWRWCQQCSLTQAPRQQLQAPTLRESHRVALMLASFPHSVTQTATLGGSTFVTEPPGVALTSASKSPSLPVTQPPFRR